jgi:GT2 family glycosyltransferase
MMSAQPDNPNGFYENQSIVDINDRWLLDHGCAWDSLFDPCAEDLSDRDLYRNDIDQVLSQQFKGATDVYIKDPRLCLLLPHWEEALRNHFCDFKVIFVKRNPFAVCKSLAKRNGMSVEKGSLLWASHILWAEFFSRHCERIFINYEDLVREPILTTESIVKFLEVDVLRDAVVQAAKAPDASLRNNRSRSYFDDSVVTRIVSELDKAFRSSQFEERTFDALRSALVRDISNYGFIDTLSAFPALEDVITRRLTPLNDELSLLRGQSLEQLSEVEKRGEWGIELSNQVSTLESLNTDLNKQLEQSSANEVDLQSEINDLQEIRRELESEVEKRGEWGIELSNQVSTLESLNTDLNRQLEQSSANEVDLQSEINDLQEIRRELESEVEKRGDWGIELSNQVSTVESLNTDLNRQLEQSSANEVELQSEINDLQEIRRELESEVEKRGDWGIELSNQVSTLESLNNDLNKQLEQSSANEVYLQSEINDLQEIRRELESEVEKRGAWGNDLTDKLQSLSQKFETAHTQIGDLENAKDEVERGLEKAVADKDKISSELQVSLQHQETMRAVMQQCHLTGMEMKRKKVNKDTWDRVLHRYSEQALGSERARKLERFTSSFVAGVKKQVKLRALPKSFIERFDEKSYLSANSDVSAAVSRGDFHSGLEHFALHGFDEVKGGVRNLCSATPFFDEIKYLASDGEIKVLIESGLFKDAFDHYLQIGHWRSTEGCNPWWHADADSQIRTNLLDLDIFDPTSIDLSLPVMETFVEYENPEISIIVPVHNKPEYTIACLVMIKRKSLGLSYEVIVIDDCSSDELALKLDESFDGVTFVFNNKNLGFIRSCNQAAQRAKGRYLVFLNNDTNVQANWLQELISPFRCDSEIAITGAKLVYPDGRLQEAGGIIWDDGSGWNYGRLDDRSKPQYNYFKSVDFVSGAALAVEHEFWKGVGGFDERFVPAYYEDVDLCFTAHSLGRKVLFVPSSVVVHYEGISNGVLLTEGIKKHQVINQEKFVSKWKSTLSGGHFSNGHNVFHARDRSQERTHILFIDHYIPQPDRDAGSRAAYDYLKLLVNTGASVHFLGDNFWHYPGDPYTANLENLGIEVLVGSEMASGWEEWLQDNGDYFDYVILSRPHIAPKYIDKVRQHSSAVVIYMAVDLVFLRESRELEAAGDISPEDQITLDSKRNSELALMGECDYTLVYSPHEVEVISKYDDSISVIDIPLYVLDEFAGLSYHPEDRKSVVFVGGFAHGPNVDAVTWLIEEVIPQTALPSDVVINVVGSNAPDSLIELMMACPQVEYLGFRTDLELSALMDQALLSIAPLRFGAGIKGKVVDSMWRGVPVLTTTVGAEGIGGAECGLVVTGIESSEYARELGRCLTDSQKLLQMSRLALTAVGEMFSHSTATDKLKRCMPHLGTTNK